MILGQTLAFVTAFTAAFYAGHRLFQIVDTKPRIVSPTQCNNNRKPDQSGSITYKNVHFRYPTQPHVPILSSFDLEIMNGKSVALVGSSGCGKSTCIQLLQRLYEADEGRIQIGADDISRDLSIAQLRAQLSIVSQEPTLFDRSIAENIMYGDNERSVTEDEMILASKIANIHEFIIALPLVK